MGNLFSIKMKIGLAVALVILLAAIAVLLATLVHWYISGEWVWQWGKLTFALTLAGLLSTLCLSSHWFFKHTWKHIGRFVAKEVPDVSGRWEGHISSNFPIHQKINDYCKAEPSEPPFNNWSLTDPHFFDLKPFKAEIDINMTYTGVDVTMTVFNDTGERQSASFTVTGAAELITEGQKTIGRISYLYKSEKDINQGRPQEPEDDPEHYGSGILDIMMSGDKVEMLKGIYWTQRNWAKGRNTGGRMEFTKAP